MGLSQLQIISANLPRGLQTSTDFFPEFFIPHKLHFIRFKWSSIILHYSTPTLAV